MIRLRIILLVLLILVTTGGVAAAPEGPAAREDSVVPMLREKEAPEDSVVAGPPDVAGATLIGTVRDASDGTALILATVLIAPAEASGAQGGTVSDGEGRFVFERLATGTYTIEVRSVGFHSIRRTITLAEGRRTTLTLDLKPRVVEADEVTVWETRQDRGALGIANMAALDLSRLPAIGEADLFRSLQLLPGVKASSDYSSGLYIRGGGPDQTLVLLDNSTIYNPSHIFGFYSSFNPDAVRDVKLYKGGYPAEYGGRLGAVVDVSNREGNTERTRGTLSIGLLSSRAMIEGPAGPLTYMVAARRSTLEPAMAWMRRAKIEGAPDKFYFYDVNAKVGLRLSRADRLTASFYRGHDRLVLPFITDAAFDVSMGNRAASLVLTHVFSPRLVARLTASESGYASNPYIQLPMLQTGRANTVAEQAIRSEWFYTPTGAHSFQLGFGAGRLAIDLDDRRNQATTLSRTLHTDYLSGYAQHTWRPAASWEMTAGLRAGYYNHGDRLQLEPRLSTEYRPAAGTRLQVGYGRYYQFLSLTASELFAPFDLWLSAGNDVRPSYGDQYLTGIKQMFGNGFYVDAEAYYRTMNNLFEFSPEAGASPTAGYGELFRYGRGQARGFELQVGRDRGRLTGFLGYSLGRTERSFPGIAQGRPFSPKYDRLHDLNLVAALDLGRRWKASSVVTYGTGQAYTQPKGLFRMFHNPFTGQPEINLSSEYNNARLPAYSRVDLALARTGSLGHGIGYEVQAQVINVLAARNVWFYYYNVESASSVSTTTVNQIPVPIPSVNLTLRF